MRSMVEGKINMLAGPRRTVERARKLRRSMSVPEVMLWARLRERPGGFKFRRQHPAGHFVLDFFCSESLLAIEIDGIGHDMGARPMSDTARDHWFEERGVAILRIPARDVSRNIDDVIETIVFACIQRRDALHRFRNPSPPGGETL